MNTAAAMIEGDLNIVFTSAARCPRLLIAREIKLAEISHEFVIAVIASDSGSTASSQKSLA